MISVKNIDRCFEIHQDKFFKIIWEFNLDDKKYCIEYYFYYETHIFKITFNQKVITEEKNDEKFNLYSFTEEEHDFSIIHDYHNYIHGLLIDKILVDKFPSKMFWSIIVRDKREDNIEDEKIGPKSPINLPSEPMIINGSNEKEEQGKKEKSPRNAEEEDEDKFLINIKFFNIEDNILYPKKILSGLLNLCLIKYMSDFFDNKVLEKINPEIKTIIIKLRKNIDIKKDDKVNIEL